MTDELKKAFEAHKNGLREVAIHHYPILTTDALEQARGEVFEILPSDIGKAYGETLLGLAEAELDVITVDLVSKKLSNKKDKIKYLTDTYKVDKKYAETVLTHSKKYAYSSDR